MSDPCPERQLFNLFPLLSACALAVPKEQLRPIAHDHPPIDAGGNDARAKPDTQRAIEPQRGAAEHADARGDGAAA